MAKKKSGYKLNPEASRGYQPVSTSVTPQATAGTLQAYKPAEDITAKLKTAIKSFGDFSDKWIEEKKLKAQDVFNTLRSQGITDPNEIRTLIQNKDPRVAALNTPYATAVKDVNYGQADALNLTHAMNEEIKSKVGDKGEDGYDYLKRVNSLDIDETINLKVAELGIDKQSTSYQRGFNSQMNHWRVKAKERQAEIRGAFKHQEDRENLTTLGHSQLDELSTPNLLGLTTQDIHSGKQVPMFPPTAEGFGKLYKYKAKVWKEFKAEQHAQGKSWEEINEAELEILDTLASRYNANVDGDDVADDPFLVTFVREHLELTEGARDSYLNTPVYKDKALKILAKLSRGRAGAGNCVPIAKELILNGQWNKGKHTTNYTNKSGDSILMSQSPCAEEAMLELRRDITNTGMGKVNDKSLPPDGLDAFIKDSVKSLYVNNNIVDKPTIDIMNDGMNNIYNDKTFGDFIDIKGSTKNWADVDFDDLSDEDKQAIDKIIGASKVAEALEIYQSSIDSGDVAYLNSIITDPKARLFYGNLDRFMRNSRLPLAQALWNVKRSTFGLKEGEAAKRSDLDIVETTLAQDITTGFWNKIFRGVASMRQNNPFYLGNLVSTREAREYFEATYDNSDTEWDDLSIQRQDEIAREIKFKYLPKPKDPHFEEFLDEGWIEFDGIIGNEQAAETVSLMAYQMSIGNPAMNAEQAMEWAMKEFLETNTIVNGAWVNVHSYRGGRLSRVELQQRTTGVLWEVQEMHRLSDTHEAQAWINNLPGKGGDDSSTLENRPRYMIYQDDKTNEWTSGIDPRNTGWTWDALKQGLKAFVSGDRNVGWMAFWDDMGEATNAPEVKGNMSFYHTDHTFVAVNPSNQNEFFVVKRDNLAVGAAGTSANYVKYPDLDKDGLPHPRAGEPVRFSGERLFGTTAGGKKLFADKDVNDRLATRFRLHAELKKQDVGGLMNAMKTYIGGKTGVKAQASKVPVSSLDRLPGGGGGAAANWRKWKGK